MITPRLNNCKECADILPLIDKINCKIFEVSLKVYNNIIFGLNSYVNQTVALDLLMYKRILMYKLVNYNYAGDITVNMISSRVNLLKYK